MAVLSSAEEVGEEMRHTSPGSPQQMASRLRGTPYADTDGDGIPDEWEGANGFNPDLDDSAGDSDSDGYTNLEEFLNLVDG